MKKIFITIIFLFNILSIFSQDFDKIVEEISDNLPSVSTAKKEFQQDITVVSPGEILISIQQIDNKGNTHTTTYDFNFADIDKNTLKAKAQKDLIVINLSTVKKQKLIKKTIDDEKTSYVSAFKIYAEDIDNGRELVKMIKNAIPVAQDILDKRLKINGYTKKTNWLTQNIDEVSFSNKQYAQEFSEIENNYPGSIKFNQVVFSGKTEKNKTYLFNLSGLSPRQITFEIKGEILGVKVGTRHNAKVIKVLENEQVKGFTNNFIIVCRDVEQARDIQKVLSDLIPLATEKFNRSVPQISSLEDGYEIMNTMIDNVEGATIRYSQNFKGDCIGKFSLTTQTSKKEIIDEYEFNWADIDKNKIKISNKGEFLVLYLQTKADKKFIKHLKEEELNNYTSSFKIFVPQIEKALILQKTIEQIIDICKEKEKNTKKLGFNQAVNSLKNKIQNFKAANTSYEQEFDLQENKTIHYKKTVIGNKSAKEYVYEVDIKDLNPKSVEIKVSGKKVSVEVKTLHLEKIIQYYKDEKIQSYQNKFEIMAPDIETARKIKKAMIRILTK